MTALEQYLSQYPVLQLGIAASFMASFGTGAGALPVFAFPRVSQHAQDALQSLAAGMMLAAAAFSLVEPGVAAAALRTGTPVAGALLVAAAVVLGGCALHLVHKHAPHEHFFSGEEGPAVHRLRRTWLFVVAITLHNFPEGMAVGVGFGGGDVGNGVALGLAILLQNLPEGLVVALGLLAAGYRRPFSVFVAFATGFVETAGGLVGALAVTFVSAVLPWAMGFAAGAMLFVVSHEIIPETHRNGYARSATFGLICGFVLMVVLDAAFA